MDNKQISIDLRKLIIRDREKGESLRKIAVRYAVSVGAVQHIWKKYQAYGIVRDLSGRGRKRATTKREDIMIVREVQKNPKISARNIKESLNLDVSRHTIARRLHGAGLKNCIASKRPFISKINKKKRYEFAKKYIGKPLSFWKIVVWSDESKYELFGQKRRSRVWRKAKEALKEKNIQKTVKHGGGNIIVWGCFGWSGVGNLARIEGIMTAEKYIDILCENLEESILKLGLENSFIFQQDNDPKHTAKVSTKFFKDSKIKLLEWPPQSPDLNPIENLWNYLDDKVDKTNASNKTNYFKALQHAWNQIDMDYIKKLIESMPRRLEAVLKAKGGHTKY